MSKQVLQTVEQAKNIVPHISSFRMVGRQKGSKFNFKRIFHLFPAVVDILLPFDICSQRHNAYSALVRITDFHSLRNFSFSKPVFGEYHSLKVGKSNKKWY